MKTDQRSHGERGDHLWPPSGYAMRATLDEASTWNVLEQLQTTYRELVPVLLGQIQPSDALTASQRADRLDDLIAELRGVAMALRIAAARAR